MPNRIIKESICTSDTISSLTDFEFRLWVGLLVSADDAGRADARPAIIKGRIFPLRERVTTRDIDAALHGLAAKGCVALYTVDGKPYLWFPTWAEHQRIRDVKPKYPSPEESDDLRQPAATCGEPPQTAALIQSESEYKYKSITPPLSPSEQPTFDLEARLAGFHPSMRDALKEWLAYKTEKRQGYKPTGLKSFLSEAENNAKKYGAETVARSIRMSMAANYQGVMWDKASQQTGRSSKGTYDPAWNYPQNKYTDYDLEDIALPLGDPAAMAEWENKNKT